MKTNKNPFILLILLFSFQNSVVAQFSTEAYKQFLSENKNLSSSELQAIYSSGLFEGAANIKYQNVLFFDSLEIKCQITEDEKNLLAKNGFVVTERLQKGSFGEQFADIYHKDLPVYISSDAILHAFHSSYGKILKDTEVNILIGKMDELLTAWNNNFPDLESNVNTQAHLDEFLRDLDVYLTTPRKLLKGFAPPFYSENRLLIDSLINEINSEKFVTRPLFSKTTRKIDFSQFKPRGHYDDEYLPQLAKYFKVMMWFGKIELYLIAPAEFVKVPITDIQRQVIMAALFSKLIDLSNTRELFNEVEYIIRTFVGEQDNVTLPQLEEVLSEAKITSVDMLLDTLVVKEFQKVLKTKSFAEQKILSQILMQNPMHPDSLEPASAFMPFGQRFVIDSYSTGSLVYPKVKSRPYRILPSTLDILFALGNDASAQLLDSELDTYGYSPNLAALRYLIDSYEFDFWNNSIYNLWLNSIRTLNPGENRTSLPSFMQTAAWWQHKMNTQLSSWTELRHDNLLYAKQSYTGGIICSYPYSYVEPVPDFFNSISILAANTLQKLISIASIPDWQKENFAYYFNTLSGVADTLKTIAQKELDHLPFNENEKNFLKRIWYPKLYYDDYDRTEFYKADYLVADYHTAPTDASGAPVGWVKHAGTGPVDMAIIIAKNSGNNDVAFIGPVSSYYEYTSTNFTRLTDDEWKENYLFQHGIRPNWTNIYLADINGTSKPEGLSLLTKIDEPNSNIDIPKSYITAQNYPNPFNPSTVIQFTISQNLTNKKTELTIYNIQGEVVKELLNEQLPSGTYLTKWNGDNKFGNKVSSGVYFYEVKSGSNKFVGKMNLLK